MNLVSIISIGDELLIGQTINTNASWIGEKLTELGFEVKRIYTIGDDKDEILSVMSLAEKNSNFIFITGGLGPTHDDITRTCIVEYFSTELVFDELSFERIKKLFERRNIPMPEISRYQAFIPKIAKPIPNNNGTAPGYEIERGGKRFFIMPGVPYEMKGMMEETILPELRDYIKNKGIHYNQKTLYTTGIPESELYSRLGNINELKEDVKVAFLPSQFGVKIRLSMRSNDESYNLTKINIVKERIIAKVGEFVYSDDEPALEVVVGKILLSKGLKLAIAESCTGGLIANRITNVPGSSNYFERGLITYSNQSKIELLNVSPNTINRFGAVSAETAIEMARGIRLTSKADIGLSVTGIMGPTGETPGKPIGLVFVGYSDNEKEFSRQFNFVGDRLKNKERTSQAALELLRRSLLGFEK